MFFLECINNLFLKKLYIVKKQKKIFEKSCISYIKFNNIILFIFKLILSKLIDFYFFFYFEKCIKFNKYLYLIILVLTFSYFPTIDLLEKENKKLKRVC